MRFGQPRYPGIKPISDDDGDGVYELPEGASGVSVPSVETDTLNGTPATVTWGDSGELVPLADEGARMNDASTTETTYDEGTNGLRDMRFPARHLSITNIETYYLSLVVRLSNTTSGETTYAKLYDADGNSVVDGSETTHAGQGYSTAESDLVEVSVDGPRTFHAMQRVSGGEGRMVFASIALWGEVA